VANHVQFQVADDPANHRASDRPIGRYRRLSSLSAQALQTKNRCRANLRFGPGILMPNSHRRDKSLLLRQVVRQCEFGIKRESSIDDGQNLNKLQSVINVLCCTMESKQKTKWHQAIMSS